MTTTTTRSLRQYSLKSTMDSAGDKEERKREVSQHRRGNIRITLAKSLVQYNRLAQREFRMISQRSPPELSTLTRCSGRRRKEHLKNLEQAQKEQSSEQSEEIERLRYQNDELRRENEALRAQLYGTSSTQGLLSTQMTVPPLGNDGRQYSLSPSISGASLSTTGSPPATMSSDMMPMAALSLTSSMLPPSMQAYADPSALASQQYSLVQHTSGLRHSSVHKSSPESSGFRSSRPAMGTPFQSLNIPQSVEAQLPQASDQRRLSGQPLCVFPSKNTSLGYTDVMLETW
jgi:hypothetical protein